MSALTVVETDLAYDSRKDTVHTRQSPRIRIHIDRSIDPASSATADATTAPRARIQRDRIFIHTYPTPHGERRAVARRAPRAIRASREDTRARYPHRDDDRATTIARRPPRARAMRRDATHKYRRTWILVALKAATRETKEDARSADIVRGACAGMPRARRRRFATKSTPETARRRRVDERSDTRRQRGTHRPIATGDDDATTRRAPGRARVEAATGGDDDGGDVAKVMGVRRARDFECASRAPRVRRDTATRRGAAWRGVGA